MKNWTPYLIAALVVVYLGGSFISQEYANIRNAIGETKQKADSVADETKQTIESIRQTIDDLRSKFKLLETQLSAKQQTQQNPVDDVAEVSDNGVDDLPFNKPTVLMYSAKPCGPCQKWKRESMPAWESQGWDVKVFEAETITQPVPRFEIFDGKRRFTVQGYLTKELYEQARRGATIE
jgi:hypothetical protein